MNKQDANVIAESITNEQLKTMLDIAKSKITDWTQTSSVNKTITKGTSWNILGQNFDVNYNYHFLAKRNMICEFGEFLPNELKPKKKERKIKVIPLHQEPKF